MGVVLVVVVREVGIVPPLPLPAGAAPAGGGGTAGVEAIDVLPPVWFVVIVLGLMLHSIAAVSAERPCRGPSVSWCDVSEDEEMPPPDEKGKSEVEEEIEEEGLQGAETASPEEEEDVPPGEDGGSETGSSLSLFLLLALLVVLVWVSRPASGTWSHARAAPLMALLGNLVISKECTMDLVGRMA